MKSMNEVNERNDSVTEHTMYLANVLGKVLADTAELTEADLMRVTKALFQVRFSGNVEVTVKLK